MAILLIAKADPLMPAYNPLKFIYASTNSGFAGFKFVFDVYESGTVNKIGEYRVLPAYGTGYGEIDLTKLLQAKVSYDLNPTNTTVYNATDSHYKYDLAIGEEYVTTVQYFLSLTNNGGNVQINVANTFVAGDQINISQSDGGVANPNLEGLFTVLSVGAGYLVVNSPWSLVTDATINGDITYADGRRTINRALRQDKNNYVFNGAIRWKEWPAYDYQNYLLNASTDLFLTTLPQDNYYATLGQDLWMNAVNEFPSVGTHRMVFTNNTGDIIDKDVTDTDYVIGISVGPNNNGATNVVAGSLPLIKPNTQYYDFYYEYAGAPASQHYRIYIDRRYRSVEYEIIFLDRMGSWGSFSFTGRAYEKGQVTREQFNRDVAGYITGGSWTYNLQDRGFTNSYVSVENTIDLNTDWMTEEMAQYFSELISSPETYVKQAIYAEDCELPESTEYISCNIMTPTFELFKKRNKNLIRQSITIKLANNDIVNG